MPVGCAVSPSPSASVDTSRALHERDGLLDHRLSNKNSQKATTNTAKAIKPTKTKAQNTKSKQQQEANAIGRFFVGFVDFPFRAINLHCANVVVVVALVLFFIIKIYNIYCHKPGGDYDIWSSTCSPHAATSHKKCECAAQKTREKTGEALREAVDGKSSLCHCLHTKPLSNSRSSARSRFHWAESGLRLSLAAWQLGALSFLLLHVLLVSSFVAWRRLRRLRRLHLCGVYLTRLPSLQCDSLIHESGPES